MSLDHLARDATQELLDRTAPATDDLLVNLKHTRRRRTVEGWAAALTALVLVAGSWAALTHDDDDDRPQPARPPAVHNGAIVVAPDYGAGAWQNFTSFGAGLRLPEDSAKFASAAFTIDGSELVYPGRGHRMMAIDVTTGETRVLGACPDDICVGALSPDGKTLAFGANRRLEIQDVATGASHTIPTPGVTYAGHPTWSSDGRHLAFGGPHGVYTVDVQTEKFREVYRYTDNDQLFLNPSWSPDGTRLGLVDPRPRAGNPPEYTFVLMTVAVDGSRPHDLHTAGHCVCLGLPAPSVTWSPDGDLIAVAVTQGEDGAGIYTIRPDGTGWERLHPGTFGDIAWQPTVD